MASAAIGFLAALAYLAADFPRPASWPAWLDVVAALVLGAVIGALFSPRTIATLTLIAAAAVAVLAFTDVMRGPIHRWIRRDSIPAEPLDAVVVLSSSVSSDSLLDPAAVERLVSGLELMRSNRAHLLITTRSAVSRSDRRMVSDADRRRLIALAGDTTLWRAVGPVYNTHDEAAAAAALLIRQGQRRVAVVTSPLHTRRACAAFEREGFLVTCVPADERLYAITAFDSPSDRLHATADWLYERLAMVEYRLRGWTVNG